MAGRQRAAEGNRQSLRPRRQSAARVMLQLSVKQMQQALLQGLVAPHGAPALLPLVPQVLLAGVGTSVTLRWCLVAWKL